MHGLLKISKGFVSSNGRNPGVPFTNLFIAKNAERDIFEKVDSERFGGKSNITPHEIDAWFSLCLKKYVGINEGQGIQRRTATFFETKDYERVLRRAFRDVIKAMQSNIFTGQYWRADFGIAVNAAINRAYVKTKKSREGEETIEGEIRESNIDLNVFLKKESQWISYNIWTHLGDRPQEEREDIFQSIVLKFSGYVRSGKFRGQYGIASAKAYILEQIQGHCADRIDELQERPGAYKGKSLRRNIH